MRFRAPVFLFVGLLVLVVYLIYRFLHDITYYIAANPMAGYGLAAGLVLLLGAAVAFKARARRIATA